MAVAIEKSRITLNGLVCDLLPDKRLAIPKNTELRDRALAELVRKRRKPIVLIVDEAHDLRQETFISLKRLIEAAAEGEGKLSVLLAGHPKLRRDLRSPTMEEIGYRTTVFSLEGVTGSQREYIEWTLRTCAAEGMQVDNILDPAAVDLLASRLRTPLQIEQHLTLALETGYQASEKPVGEGIVDSVLSEQIDDLEPTLTRHGYTAKVLADLLGSKPGEVRALFRQTLGAALPRTEGSDARRRAAGMTRSTHWLWAPGEIASMADRRTPVLPGLPAMGCAAVYERSASVISPCFAAGTPGLCLGTALAG